MDLASIDITTRNAWAAGYSAQGLLVIRNVALPAGFEPRITDVVFLAVDSACEVFIDARSNYTGPTPHWHDLMRGNEFPGQARFVARAVDFFSAIRTLARLLATAQPVINPAPALAGRDRWLQKLGLSGNPTVEQIKKAFRSLALSHHPDRMVGASASELKAAGNRMREIAEAYGALLRRNPK